MNTTPASNQFPSTTSSGRRAFGWTLLSAAALTLLTACAGSAAAETLALYPRGLDNNTRVATSGDCVIYEAITAPSEAALDQIMRGLTQHGQLLRSYMVPRHCYSQQANAPTIYLQRTDQRVTDGNQIKPVFVPVVAPAFVSSPIVQANGAAMREVSIGDDSLYIESQPGLVAETARSPLQALAGRKSLAGEEHLTVYQFDLTQRQIVSGAYFVPASELVGVLVAQ